MECTRIELPAEVKPAIPRSKHNKRIREAVKSGNAKVIHHYSEKCLVRYEYSDNEGKIVVLAEKLPYVSGRTEKVDFSWHKIITVYTFWNRTTLRYSYGLEFIQQKVFDKTKRIISQDINFILFKDTYIWPHINISAKVSWYFKSTTNEERHIFGMLKISALKLCLTNTVCTNRKLHIDNGAVVNKINSLTIFNYST